MDARRFDYANLANLHFIETLYADYLEDPSSVDPSWQRFFEGMAFASQLNEKPSSLEPTQESPDLRIFHLIEAYRQFGHLAAQSNPFNPDQKQPEDIEELTLKRLGFDPKELEESFPTCQFFSKQQVPLKELIHSLQQTYCGKVGFEYMGLQTPSMEKWIQERIEPGFSFTLSQEEKMRILRALNRSKSFESFIHMKYPGQKRFSLEGGEVTIPILEEMVLCASEEGVQDIVLGMTHRGRLNVLANIFEKSYAMIFSEFEAGYLPCSFEGSGDVKYHLGYTAKKKLSNGKTIHLELSSNPSHLESVDPVVMGKVRAKQALTCEGEKQTILPILIHGDAALPGQGVVYETLQMYRLKGYCVGGTIHLVINNQVGFTASSSEAHSTPYCTDIAKTFGAPVFHVNGEDPESCIVAAKLAVQIRQIFHCDVFIEIHCHRKYGHNESDEPGFTNPVLYRMIQNRKNVRDLYLARLLEEKVVTQQEINQIEESFKQDLHQALKETKELAQDQDKRCARLTPPKKEGGDLSQPVVTYVDQQTLITLAKSAFTAPPSFHLHPKLKRILNDRIQKVVEDPTKKQIDWGTAETLAYATLLEEGTHVRLSGQDSGRGTFSHRHAILVDQETRKRYYPLSHLSSQQAPFSVYNSFLSENGVMGFEYGYSTVYPHALVIWEGQFGDFANGAQVVIDQFVTSAERKWSKSSNLVLFLPHGYEGQGPEHSSARIERFLQMCANDNMVVCLPTHPAQLFHLLRRHIHLKIMKPLIVFTPKALLRFPPSLSRLEELTSGGFQEVIEDVAQQDTIKRVIFCSGKVYYDLLEEREKKKRKDTAIVRLEQLYPIPKKSIQSLLKKYAALEECYWVQEEHANMGAWEFIHSFLDESLPEKVKIQYVGRKRSASPAAGSYALHQLERMEFLGQVF